MNPLTRVGSSSSYPLPQGNDRLREAVQQVLHPLGFSPEGLIEALSTSDRLRECYSMDAGVSEGYTIGEHTRMVLEVADRFHLALMSEVEPMVDWYDFLVFLALHDIGKGFAEQNRNVGFSTSATFKEAELENTQAIMRETMKALGFSESKIAIFSAMLMYDSQGLYLKGEIGLEEIVDNVLEMAKKCGMDPLAFYRLFGAYHKADAASYPGLRNIFGMEGEALTHCSDNQNKVDRVVHALQAADQGQHHFTTLMEMVRQQHDPAEVAKTFVKHLPQLQLFLEKMHKEMLKGLGEQEAYRAVKRGFRDLILYLVRTTPPRGIF